jgi:hypothetical protein
LFASKSIRGFQLFAISIAAVFAAAWINFTVFYAGKDADGYIDAFFSIGLAPIALIHTLFALPFIGLSTWVATRWNRWGRKNV